MNTMRFVLLFVALSAGWWSYGQSVSSDSVSLWLANERYTDINNTLDTVPYDSLTATMIYYNGLAHFVQEHDSLALVWFDEAISRNPFLAGPYYYAGLIKQVEEDWRAAVPYFEAAVKNDNQNAAYLLALADVYQQLGWSDSTFKVLQLAVQLPNVPAKAYGTLAEFYRVQGAEKKALDVYYDCLYKANPNSDNYTTCLYNVGYFELKANRPQDAELALRTLLSFDTRDYAAIELLVQALVRQEKVKEMNEWAGKLYYYHRQDSLPPIMANRFQLDAFKWDTLDVLVYEYFDEPDTGYTKFAFWVVDDSNTVVRKIHAVLQPNIGGRNEYFLVDVTDPTAQLYTSRVMRKSRLNYYLLRQWVMDILQGRYAPESERPRTLFD